MHMRINATGKNQFAFCIDGFIGFDLQILSDKTDRFIFNKNISYLVCIRCDDSSVFNE